MAKDGHHRLISLPISINEMKRGDSKAWGVLLITAVVAIAVVVALNLFVERKPVKWPTSPTTVPATTAASPADDRSSEPRTYDVAPPSAVPPKPRTR